MTEAELLADRATGIGGSDVASVLGVGYGCPLRLYRQKRGEVPDYPREETAAMELGKLLEPWVAKKFAEKYGADLKEVAMQRSSRYPFLLVHADRLYWKMTAAIGGVLEIKAVGSRVFYQAKREGLPIDYLLQLQWGMGLWRSPVGAFAIVNRDNGEILDWEHGRDDELLEMARDKAISLWSDIQAGNPPARLEPDDRRCQRCEYRRTCQGNALIQVSDKKIEADESLRPLLADYEIMKADAEIATDALEAQKELIRDAMGDRGAVACGQNKVYYRSQVRESWATDAMAKDWCRLAGKVDYDGEFIPAAPAVVLERFHKPGMPFRVLRVY